MRNADAYLVYHVDKGLGITSGEVIEHLDLVIVSEDGCHQRDALVCGKVMTNQQFPGWDVTVHENAIKSVNARSLE